MRVNITYTITAGKPINLLSGVPAKLLNAASKVANHLFIQALHGQSCGLIFVMTGIAPPTVANAAASGCLTAELAPASPGAPGGSYEDPGPATDCSQAWIDGLHSGDKVVVSMNLLGG